MPFWQPRLHHEAEQLGITLQDRVGNETIGDIVDQHSESDKTNWLNMMLSWATPHRRMCATQEDEDDREEQEPTEVAAQVDNLATCFPSSITPRCRGACAIIRLLAIQAKSDECYKAADVISSALDQLGAQLQQHLEAQQAEWAHSTEEHKDLYTLREYANKACQRTSGRINIPREEFNYRSSHPNQVITVSLGDPMSYLADYTMREDFMWSMEDSKPKEPMSKELTEADVPQFRILADHSTIKASASEVLTLLF